MVLKVGLVGTGYAAAKRAEALIADDRAELVAVCGNRPEKIKFFCENYSCTAIDSPMQLVNLPELDLIIVSTINRDHSMIARAALESGKNVVVEYPLAIAALEAEELIALAKQVGKLLHVEHIELLGGVHQAIRQHLQEIGNIYYARYVTINPDRPSPYRWTYNHEMFGFPLIGALSRLHRFTDLFGHVASVSCQARFWDAAEHGYYSACLCNALLRYQNGLIAEVSYGKGEVFTNSDRTFTVYGDRGMLIFEGEKGFLVQGQEKRQIEVLGRQGLFAKDTKMVLDHLLNGEPLYIDPIDSCYSLKVAEGAYLSAKTGKTVELI